MNFIKLRHRVIGATWDEQALKWTVKVQGPDGTEINDVCDVLISATGPLK